MKPLSFDQKCYKLLKKIPKGKVTTYKEIADAIGTKAYRAVGNAMKKNKNPIVIPCHRVVKSNGEIGGYSKGISKKIKLLKKEGIEIKNHKIDLEKFGYFFN
jgi:methylated-DNA-[protein]-cysteine S-methyltransferase